MKTLVEHFMLIVTTAAFALFIVTVVLLVQSPDTFTDIVCQLQGGATNVNAPACSLQTNN